MQYWELGAVYGGCSCSDPAPLQPQAAWPAGWPLLRMRIPAHKPGLLVPSLRWCSCSSDCPSDRQCAGTGSRVVRSSLQLARERGTSIEPKPKAGATYPTGPWVRLVAPGWAAPALPLSSQEERESQPHSFLHTVISCCLKYRRSSWCVGVGADARAHISQNIVAGVMEGCAVH